MTKINIFNTCCVSLGVALFFSTVCFAEDNYWNKFTEAANLNLGAGVIISDEPYAGAGSETYVVPFGNVKYKDLFFEGIKLGYTVYDNNNVTIAPILQWRFDGYDETDSPELTGMDNRYTSMDAGIQFKYKTPIGSFRASWLIDVLSNSNGQEVEIGFSKRFPNISGLNKLSLTPGVGISFYNDKLANYYFGVRPNEARPGRPAYNPNCSFNFYAGINALYQLTEKWSITGGAYYTLYDTNIQNSPIVADEGTMTFTIGMMYKF